VLCDCCPNRSWCEDLCAEAEAWVEQDRVAPKWLCIDDVDTYYSELSWTELINSLWEFGGAEWDLVKYLPFTEAQRYCFYQYYWKNKNTVSLALELEITHQAVVQHIQAAELKVWRHFHEKQLELPFNMVGTIVNQPAVAQTSTWTNLNPRIRTKLESSAIRASSTYEMF